MFQEDRLALGTLRHSDNGTLQVIASDHLLSGRPITGTPLEARELAPVVFLFCLWEKAGNMP